MMFLRDDPERLNFDVTNNFSKILDQWILMMDNKRIHITRVLLKTQRD